MLPEVLSRSVLSRYPSFKQQKVVINTGQSAYHIEITLFVGDWLLGKSNSCNLLI